MGFSNPYYIQYLIVVAAILAVTGTVLVILRTTKLKANRIVDHSWKAYCSWLVMAGVIFAVIGLGRTSFIIGTAVLAVFCVREFSKATGLYKDKWFMSVIFVSVLVIHFCAYIGWYGLFIIIPVFAVSILFMVPIFRNETKGMVQKVGLSSMAIIYLGWFPGHLAFLANHPQWFAYVLFLILGVVMNDMFAFIFGSIFGKKLLVTNVSPKKSVEGAIGSMFAVALYIWLVKGMLPGFTTIMLVYSFIIISICGTVGDLVISVIKRDIGVKDMGSFIPGHGGLLDRVDSLLIAAPFLFHLIRYMIGFPGMEKMLTVIIP